MKKILLATILALGYINTANATGQIIDVGVASNYSRLEEHKWHNSVWVAGEKNSPYSLTLHNPNPYRVLVVVSVDGLNVITGNKASTQDQGYIINPYSSTEIAGWRKNTNQVAQFYFSSKDYSYSNRVGEGTQNTGVIGVAVFKEAYQHRYPGVVSSEPPVFESQSLEDSYSREYSGKKEGGTSIGSVAKNMARAPGGPSESFIQRKQETKQELGTGHGRSIGSYVEYDHFERASNRADEIINLYYDSRENLVKRGIIPDYSHRRDYIPRPFSDDNDGFARDPNW